MAAEMNNTLDIPFVHPTGHLSVIAVLSNAEFTFKIEQFTRDVTIINVTAVVGSANIKLPQGVIVRVEGSNLSICGSVNEHHVPPSHSQDMVDPTSNDINNKKPHTAIVIV